MVALLVLLIALSVFGEDRFKDNSHFYRKVKMDTLPEDTNPSYAVTRDSSSNILKSYPVFNFMDGRSVGVISSPSWTNNNDSTINVDTGRVYLRDNSNFTGSILGYPVGDTTNLHIPENVLCVLAVVYNGGNPVYEIKSYPNIGNVSDECNAWAFVRETGETWIHSASLDEMGKGKLDRLYQMLQLTNPYRYIHNDFETLTCTESSTPNYRTVVVPGGNMYSLNIITTLLDFNSSVDSLSYVFHSGGDWVKDRITQYPNTHYDNGTDTVSLGNNKYVSLFHFRTIGDDKEVFTVLGRQQHTQADDAWIEFPPSDVMGLAAVTWHSDYVGHSVVRQGDSSGITVSTRDGLPGGGVFYAVDSVRASYKADVAIDTFTVWNPNLSDYMRLIRHTDYGIIQTYNNDPLAINPLGNSVSIGITQGDGTFHVHSGSAGTVTAGSSNDDAVFESSGETGTTVLTPDANSGRYSFGSPSDNFGASMGWKYDSLLLEVATYSTNAEIVFKSGNGVYGMRLNSSQNLSMLSHKIVSLEPGTNDGDAVNVSQLNTKKPKDSTYIYPHHPELTSGGYTIKTNLHEDTALTCELEMVYMYSGYPLTAIIGLDPQGPTNGTFPTAKAIVTGYYGAQKSGGSDGIDSIFAYDSMGVMWIWIKPNNSGGTATFTTKCGRKKIVIDSVYTGSLGDGDNGGPEIIEVRRGGVVNNSQSGHIYYSGCDTCGLIESSPTLYHDANHRLIAGISGNDNYAIMDSLGFLAYDINGVWFKALVDSLWHRYIFCSTLIAGSGTNNTTIDGTNGITLTGNATQWKDIQFATSSGRVPPANAPTWTTFSSYANKYTFDVDDYLDLQDQEVDHGFNENSDSVEFHVHMFTNGTDGTDRTVAGKIYFAFVSTDSAYVADSISFEGTIPASTPDRTFLYVDAGSISVSDYEINAGDGITVRIKREASSGTEPTSDPFLSMVGLHIEMFRIGSIEEVP